MDVRTWQTGFGANISKRHIRGPMAGVFELGWYLFKNCGVWIRDFFRI